MNLNCFFLILVYLFIAAPAKAQTIAEAFINGDALPDPPELAARGPYKVGVHTLTLINKDQADILHSY